VRYDRIILVLLAALLLATLFYRSRPGSFEPTLAASVVAAPAAGYVRIAGAVRHPGMYEATANMMAIDVIKMAVPVRAVIAAVLEPFATVPVVSGDAFELLIRPDGTVSLTRGAIPVAERLVMGIPLDINSMNDVDFDRVPGIGPSMASRIVAYRQKNGGKMSKQDLILIEGIGEKKFAAISRYFN
jgi:competence protein ComEA